MEVLTMALMILAKNEQTAPMVDIVLAWFGLVLTQVRVKLLCLVRKREERDEQGFKVL